MNIGFFGGTFDPIHNAHVAVAEAAIHEYGLDKVYLCPSITPPWKPETTPYHHRFAMVALAASTNPKLVPISLGNTGYTCDEVWWLRHLHPEDQIFFIVGMDAWLTLEKWKDAQFILDKVDKFVVSSRPGYSFEDANKLEINDFTRALWKKSSFCSAVYLETSATSVREAIMNGQQLSRFAVNRLVRQYIRKTCIYTPAVSPCSSPSAVQS